MVREILLKLPTRDVLRSSCVSKQWRDVVKDPSFPKLHAAEHAVPSPGGGAEALLVTVNSVPGGGLEPRISSVTSSKHMCRLADSMAMSYVATNVCNGFICFGPRAYGVAPAVLCNPATGETLALPGAPPFPIEGMDRHLFLLGFNQFTGEYKLFRISFREIGDDRGNYIDVYTLGDSRRWRKHPLLFPLRHIDGVPPVLVDGKLYVLTGPDPFVGKPEGILVVDVASEAHCTYCLPSEYVDPMDNTLVDVFELHGRLCLAVNYILVSPDRPKVEFWVMPRLGELDGKNHRWLNWELRYTFYVDVDHGHTQTPYAWGRGHYKDLPRAAWLDKDELLCYVLGDCLYKYNTRTSCYSRSRPDPDGFLEWHRKVQLPTASSPSNRRLNIYGGYRPSLLSPLAFALPPSKEDEDTAQYEHAMLCGVRPRESKRHRCSNDRSAGETQRKRICRGTNFTPR
jgi:F-box interacting protein